MRTWIQGITLSIIVLSGGVESPAMLLASFGGQVRVIGQGYLQGPAKVKLLRLGEPVSEQFTDLAGQFQFPDVSPGPYIIAVEYPGAESAFVSVDVLGSQRDFIVELGQRRVVDTKSPYPVPLAEYQIPRPARQEFDRARKEQKSLNCPKALEHLRKALRAFPQYAEAHNEMGRCYRQLGELRQAEEAFQAAVRLGVSAVPALNLADLYVAQGRLTEARDLLREMIRRYPDEGDAYFALANVHFEERDLKEAEALGLAAHARAHRNADVHLLLAKIYLRQESRPAIVRELELYVQEAPNTPLRQRVQQALQEASARP